MIVKIFAGGKSFKGAAAYLTHDPEAETADRVAWTHTHNLTHDHVPSAVDEMLWTARDAELLKQEAGIRAGGRACETPVKHVSLNWPPQDAPTREHMIETGESFLQKMGWQKHQAIFIAHSDKEHTHIHLLMNAVDPDTGLKLNEGFEQRRAQAWALQYEREQGRIDCEQRLKDPRDRQDAPTREAWMAFRENQKEFERAEQNRRETADHSTAAGDDHDVRRKHDWKILKDFQRDERLAFFADGKAAFAETRAEVFRGVREDFRERWSAFYSEQRNGADLETLREAKSALVAEQKLTLDQRRDEACASLRANRDEAYRGLLNHQNDTRLIFRERLAAGLDNTEYLQQLRAEQAGPAAAFAEAGKEVTGRQAEPEADAHAGSAPAGGRDATDTLTAATGMGFLSIGESLFATFIAAKPARRTAEEVREERDLFAAAARATASREQHDRDNADEDWRKRQRERVGD